MFPPGLKGPGQDDFRDAPPADHPPADYPSRLPFVSNQAVSYAESEDMAGGIWAVLPPGQSPPEKSQRTPHPAGLRGVITSVLDGVDMGVGLFNPEPTTKALLDDLFERILAAALEAEWTICESVSATFPPGGRYATLTRAGERMQLTGILTPVEPAIWAYSFADS
ncbi:MAG: hypothetical protein E4H41_11100 [Gemmatimonadales bacterium]|nr:MAG: hypothetical protein E4H41_11100 [Gemmatimonadales bacterium]